MKRVVIAAMAMAICGAAATNGWAAEEGTVKASAVWTGRGRIIPTGQGTLFYFAGTFSGILFVDDGKGALHMMKVVCPGTLEVDVNGGKQQGQGRCLLSSRDGGEVYAQWSCAGTHQVDCKGPFVLTGGTGRFAGITGRGDVHVRTAIAQVGMGPPSEGAQESSAGIAEWPALQYRIP